MARRVLNGEFVICRKTPRSFRYRRLISGERPVGETASHEKFASSSSPFIDFRVRRKVRNEFQGAFGVLRALIKLCKSRLVFSHRSHILIFRDLCRTHKWIMLRFESAAIEFSRPSSRCGRRIDADGNDSRWSRGNINQIASVQCEKTKKTVRHEEGGPNVRRARVRTPTLQTDVENDHAFRTLSLSRSLSVS